MIFASFHEEYEVPARGLLACQVLRQWIQKKGRGCNRHPPARRDSSPELQVLSSSAPARVRTSCRGRLLSTFHQVDKQSHDNAGHNLRGYVQQELLHLGILLYRRTAPEPF